MILVVGIDLLWSVVAVLGIGVALWALLDSYADRRVLRLASDYLPSGPRATIVKINIRGARASLLLHLFFLVLGVIALTSAMRTRPTLFYLALAAGYILVATTNVRAVGLNQFDRRRLRERAQ